MIVPKEFAEDPTNTRHTMTLNGEVMQDSNTNRMSHNIYELLSYASNILALNPGDVIAGGSLAGTNIERADPRCAGRRHRQMLDRRHRRSDQSRRGGIERRHELVLRVGADLGRPRVSKLRPTLRRIDLASLVSKETNMRTLRTACFIVACSFILLPGDAWSQTSLAGVVRDEILRCGAAGRDGRGPPVRAD